MTPFVVRESILVYAPMDRLFRLSTNLALVRETLGMTAMETGVTGSLTSGHVVAGSRVVWRGWKFGLPTQHHTLITGFTPPHEYVGRLGQHEVTAEAFFQDTQERGRFAFFQHDHHFYELADTPTNTSVTELLDEVRFTLPLGALGRIAARLLLAPYIRKLCRRRFERLKQLAEGEGWRPFVADGEGYARKRG
jgi:ligand-binding SRPBCC domain-containing protein